MQHSQYGEILIEFVAFVSCLFVDYHPHHLVLLQLFSHKRMTPSALSCSLNGGCDNLEAYLVVYNPI